MSHEKCDVVFLLDGSDSCGLTSFTKGKNFINEFLNDIEIGNDNSRIAVIQYSSTTLTIEVSFSDYFHGKSWITNKISAIPFQGGLKNTTGGLEKMKEVFNEDARPLSQRVGVVRNGIILTDGKEDEAPPKLAQEVDLCFLFDVTGSMGGEIDEVKEKAKSILDDVQAKYEDVYLRTAFVGYRDQYNDSSSDPFIIKDFTSDINDFKNWMNANVEADGGGDTPEDVFGGMEKVLEQDWKAPMTRILVHIADAPGHGDFVTKGSATRSQAEDLLEKLKCDTNIYSYLFIKTRGSDTDEMISAFKELSAGSSNPSQTSVRTNWLTEASVSGDEFVQKIIDQTCIAIQTVSLSKPSAELQDVLNVVMIGVGLSPNADEQKLKDITRNDTNKRRKVIMPENGEDLTTTVAKSKSIVEVEMELEKIRVQFPNDKNRIAELEKQLADQKWLLEKQKQEIAEALETAKMLEKQNKEMAEATETAKMLEKQNKDMAEALETAKMLEKQKKEMAEALETIEMLEKQKKEMAEALETTEMLEEQKKEMAEALETTKREKQELEATLEARYCALM